MLYIIIAAVGIIGGMWTYSVYKVEKACRTSYEYKILQAKIKNQEIALAYYKSAKAKADQIAEDAKKAEAENISEGSKIDEAINQPITDAVCVDDGFMRGLERIR